FLRSSAPEPSATILARQTKMTPSGSRGHETRGDARGKTRDKTVKRRQKKTRQWRADRANMSRLAPFSTKGAPAAVKVGYRTCLSDLKLTVAGQCWTRDDASPEFPHSALCIRATSAPLRVRDI